MATDVFQLAPSGGLCIFIPALLGPEASLEELDHYGQMAHAARQTWLTNTTSFVIPEQGAEAPGLLEKLAGLPTTRLTARGLTGRSLRAMLFWRHIVSLLEEGGGTGKCDWVMKVPVWSYVNAPTLKSRLDCFNASETFFLGVPTVAYSPGEEPFMFPNPWGGTIISRGLLGHVAAWTDYCMRYAETTDTPYGSDSFFDDYTFAMCLSDLGRLVASNYADMEGSFILFDRPNHTMSKFETHPDTLKQCLLVVGRLDTTEQVLRVHDRVSWSKWHTSIPCIGESQMGKFSISDAYGNSKEYYEERIRLALYYCKAPEFVYLEKSLSQRLHGLDPRAGQGALATPVPGPPRMRRHLCIFVPSSARKLRFIEAAETAWRVWGTSNTFFVSKQPLSVVLDGQTFLLENDIDTDYAHLPVRTFLLFEALGQPEWVNACDWYMKADADSFLNVPLIEQRLRCFDPSDFWFLGVPQVAHSARGAMTRFASGGAGYMISRALLPKLATWAPFCLLQLLQHAGGTGMEDVSLAGCIWKWGHIDVVSYADYETEVITSEAALNRTRVTHTHLPGEKLAVPPCAMVVHSVRPENLETVAANIKSSWQQRDSGKCIPDQSRLMQGAATLLSPELSHLDIEASRLGNTYHWAVYGEKEYEVLLACSQQQAADNSTL
ncbi:Chsy1 [Symbiodinium sp. CCMP2456]|nr:Chsy1 [Symbiodinium sp. CCMP2456]